MSVTLVSIRKQLLDYATVGDTSSSENQVYLVEVSETDATPMEVAKASGTVGGVTLPAKRAVHPIYSWLTVASKTAKRAVGSDGKACKAHWAVEVVYDDALKEVTQTENSRNVRISIAGNEQTVLTQQARDDAATPIRNAAGDMYPDPVEVTLYDEAISVEYETETLNGDTLAALRGKINDATVTLSIPQSGLTYSRSFAAKTLLMKSIDYSTIVSRTDEEDEVWSVKVNLLYRPDGWIKRVPEKGYRYMVSGELSDWKESAEYLAADGTKLGSGAAIVTREVQVHYEADLTTFLQGI